MVRNPPACAGYIRDEGSIPRLGRSPGEGHSNPLQYSRLDNPWTEEPGGLQSMGSHRIRHDSSDFTCMHARHLSDQSGVLSLETVGPHIPFEQEHSRAGNILSGLVRTAGLRGGQECDRREQARPFH